jgi:hypothetical protein
VRIVITGGSGKGGSVAIDHARRLPGYEPGHRWSDHIRE